MDKKGISPLIATILIIGFTIALAAVIISWEQTFTRQIQQETINQFALNYNNTYLVIAKNITSAYTIDCSLPRIADGNISIIYEHVVEDSNMIELSFIDFCERLRK